MIPKHDLYSVHILIFYVVEQVSKLQKLTFQNQSANLHVTCLHALNKVIIACKMSDIAFAYGSLKFVSSLKLLMWSVSFGLCSPPCKVKGAWCVDCCTLTIFYKISGDV